MLWKDFQRPKRVEIDVSMGYIGRLAGCIRKLQDARHDKSGVESCREP